MNKLASECVCRTLLTLHRQAHSSFCSPCRLSSPWHLSNHAAMRSCCEISQLWPSCRVVRVPRASAALFEDSPPPPPLPPALSRRPASFLFTNNIRAASERAGRQFGLTELCRLPRTLWNHFDFLRYSLGLLGEKTLLFVGYLALPRSIPLQSSTHCFMSNQNSHLSHST